MEIYTPPGIRYYMMLSRQAESHMILDHGFIGSNPISASKQTNTVINVIYNVKPETQIYAISISGKYIKIITKGINL